MNVDGFANRGHNFLTIKSSLKISADWRKKKYQLCKLIFTLKKLTK